VTSN